MLSPALRGAVDDGSLQQRALPPFTSRELVDLFESGQFSKESKDAASQVMPYRLFKPVEYRTGIKYPLIVWLHGNGHDEIVHQNVGQLKHLEDVVFEDTTHPQLYKFFMLAPQSPSGVWFLKDAPGAAESSEGDSVGMEEPAELVISLIDELLTRYPIDAERITLVGISSGGNACWEIAAMHPDRLAAVAPLASNGNDAAALQKIVSVPIWAFRTVGDAPENVRRTVANLQALGGNCHLTETPGVSHNCWHSAFHDHDLLSWLLAQRRGASDNPVPGARSWYRWSSSVASAYWPHLVVLGVCISSLLFIRNRMTAKKVVRPAMPEGASTISRTAN